MRMTIVGTLLWLLGLSLVARPAAPWPGPTGSYAYVEGEDFVFAGDGWQVETLRRDRDGNNAAARMQVLSGRNQGAAEPQVTVEVDADGTYRLWVRLSRWPDRSAAHRAPLRVQVEQDGEVVCEQVFDETWDGPEARKQPHTCRLIWGCADGAASLKSGPATIRLIKVGAQASPVASARRVDCVLLTTDSEYQPNARDFVPQTYLRFHLRSASLAAGYIEIFNTYMRKPWSKHFSIDRSGAHDGLYATKDRFFQIGETTQWANVSRFLYHDSPAKMMIRLTAKYSYEDAAAADYAIDFAPRPDAAAIVKTVERAGAGAFIRVVVPPDLSGEVMPKADYEYARDRAEMVSRLPPITFGRRPQKFPLGIARPASTSNTTPGVAEMEVASAAYLGTNCFDGMLSDADLAAGQRFSRSHQRIWFMGPAGFNEPQLDKLESFVARGARAFAEHPQHHRVRSIGLMDEAGAKPLGAMVGNEIDEAAFAEWLQTQGLTAERLGLTGDQQIRLVANRDSATPALYYHSQRFRAWSVANFFRLATDRIAAHYPPGAAALTTQNYSDGAVYQANMYSQGNDYYTWFKEVQAMGMAMSEDWTNLGATWQLCGWNVGLLRSATRYHRQPIVMYTISSFGRRPIDVKLKALSDIAQGAKMITFYDYTPQYVTNSSVFGARPEIFVAIAELTREIGAAEEILVDAMPRPARTAILYSRPYDIWNIDHDNSLGHERMFTYLALRHAQVPVDIICDDDVYELGLDGYDVVYAFGEQIAARAIDPLIAWVKSGGNLVLSPGAISRDEYNQPNEGIDRGLGLDRGEVRALQAFFHSSKYACMLLKPKGTVALRDDVARQVGLLARSQTFVVPAGAPTYARFTDGTPAAARVHAGRGHVYLNGFMPGLAYMQQAYQHYAVGREIDQATAGPLMEEDLTTTAAVGPAGDELVQPLRNVALALAAVAENPARRDADALRIPRAEYSYCPFAYPEPLRQMILTPVREAAITRPVELSQPVVEATFMESEMGWVVPLANYTGGPLDNVVVGITPGRASGDVHSSRQGKLETITHDGRIELNLPLESTDFIFASWLDE